MEAANENATYFFRDLIVAAWWAKRHQMRYEWDYGAEFSLNTTNDKPFDWDYQSAEGNIKLHPDSLHLLEQFTEEQKQAMKLLGLWPESENPTDA